ncbi:C-C motif chemokine 20-like [Brienomyrus brachyistius]|uniref:C-C motif chemokine 20-like n=1 Tax=Brienomyrus brachyistius TaxID=42636 RepID=UPI0020B43130|nr:C-C motif chemokine 20-like [Brienomyrus brachyistius]
MAHIRLAAASFALLLLACLLHTPVTAVCCTKYSRTPIPIMNIKGVSIQKDIGRCNINAVIFHTYKGRKQLCADPRASWVLDRIKTLREAVKRMRDNSTAQTA